jgi:hypothetical protein
MLHFFLTAIAGMVFFLLFRVPIYIAALLIWKVRYILLILIISFIAWATWDYQSRIAVHNQDQQLWTDFLHSPDYAPPSASTVLELSKTTLDPRQEIVGAQYQRYLQKRASNQ